MRSEKGNPSNDDSSTQSSTTDVVSLAGFTIEPLNNVNDLDFDLFKLNESVGRDKTLIVLSTHILKQHDLLEIVD